MNAFLASGGKVKRNLKALLIKITESLSDRAKKRILSSINKSLSGSYKGDKRNGRLDATRSEFWDVNISLLIDLLLQR